MREIKFRAWDKINNKYTQNTKFGNFDYSNTLNGIFEDENFIFEQITGLKDKTGKEIYEGDILHLKNHWPCKVEFYKGRFRLFPLDKTLAANFSSENWFLSDYIDINWVVVGNIHQNKLEEFI